MRCAGGLVASLCREKKARKICILLPQTWLEEGDSLTVQALTEGILLGDYAFQKYKTELKKKKRHLPIQEIRYISPANSAEIRRAAERGRILAFSACEARNMANEPGNGWQSDDFARYGQDLAKTYGFRCTLLSEKELRAKGMGGILAVNQGSATPPCLVILEYRSESAAKNKTVLLVGKGLTFDSGGVSLKPSAGMEEMKYDMCGGAAILAVMHVVGKERPDCNVVAIVPATDNMPGANAVKPGDIITHYNGITSEVVNTDAEGRLVLADSLAYGIEHFKPDYVIDLATLTGAVIIGLGHHYTGLFSNNDDLAQKLIQAGGRAGEPLWRLPLGEEYRKQLESKVADLKNTGGRPAGAVTAAEYLHRFVGKTPWAHLDIAGTAWNFTGKTYVPEGQASGICVRTLAEFLHILCGDQHVGQKM
ncbi:unnamed protein product [Cyprideis torosa]|uniref:Cytosol aminopeptidase n=1 Tax=Cyprideis torosa TaxID=163714 RepID=A0A7R8WV76_9CRUS|nr:unnamed protein product [Cyprideis torosa]CAG0906341.1 unnamed protein product [Cyprideis torosa]